MARTRVPLTNSNAASHRQQLARAVNDMLAGHLDASLSVTLTANASSTVVTDARISIQTAATAAPQTQHAAQELAAGSMWWEPSNGLLTITHANNAQTDRTFMFSLIG